MLAATRAARRYRRTDTVTTKQNRLPETLEQRKIKTGVGLQNSAQKMKNIGQI
jgi:hypothetical protein